MPVRVSPKRGFLGCFFGGYATQKTPQNLLSRTDVRIPEQAQKITSNGEQFIGKRIQLAVPKFWDLSNEGQAKKFEEMFIKEHDEPVRPENGGFK